MLPFFVTPEKGASMAEEKDKSLGYVSKRKLAQLFGVTSRRIEQLIEDGVISGTKAHNNRLKFDLEETIKKYVQYLSDKAKGRSQSETEADLKEQKLRAEIALKESQGELHRLRTDIALGNYIPIEAVKADYSRFFIIFKNFANTLPSKLAGRLTGVITPVEVREIEHEMQEDIKRSLEEFVSRATVEKKEVDDGITPKKVGRPRKNAEKV